MHPKETSTRAINRQASGHWPCSLPLLSPPLPQTNTNTTPTTNSIPRTRRTSSKTYRGQRGGKGALDLLDLESFCTKTAMREATLTPCLERRDTAKKNCKQYWTTCTGRGEGGSSLGQERGGRAGGDQKGMRVTRPSRSCFYRKLERRLYSNRLSIVACLQAGLILMLR